MTDRSTPSATGEPTTEREPGLGVTFATGMMRAFSDDDVLSLLGRVELEAKRRGLLIEAEARAGRAERLTDLQVAAVFQDHHPRGEHACECGWRPSLSPATTHHEHLLLTVLELFGVTDE